MTTQSTEGVELSLRSASKKGRLAQHEGVLHLPYLQNETCASMAIDRRSGGVMSPYLTPCLKACRWTQADG